MVNAVYLYLYMGMAKPLDKKKNLYIDMHIAYIFNKLYIYICEDSILFKNVEKINFLYYSKYGYILN